MIGIYCATDYGIVGDGQTNNTAAFNSLLQKIGENGGGTLYVPPGEYVTGSLFLESNTTLYIEGGATILGSADRADYPVIDENVVAGWFGKMYRGLIAARSAVNITVDGRGLINARGQNWWYDRGAFRGPVERPRTIQFLDCENVLIRGITITNSPMWTVHPLRCRNVTIDGITIKNPWDSPNTDGINPEACQMVHISNCHIDVGDDCITLKAGTQRDVFRRAPCEDITITNCTMINGHGGVVMGSEMSGGVRNVVISNCIFNGTDRGIRIKTQRGRGGCVENLRVTGIVMNDVFCPFVLNSYYKPHGPSEDPIFSVDAMPVDEGTPVFKNVALSGITATNVSACALFLYGLPESPISGITVTDYHVKFKTGHVEPQETSMANKIPYMAKAGIFLRNGEDCTFRNVRIDTDGEGNPLEMENCNFVSINGFDTRKWPADSIIQMKNCKSVSIADVGDRKAVTI